MKTFLNRLVRNTCYEQGINGGLCKMCRKPWDNHFVSGDDTFVCPAVEEAVTKEYSEGANWKEGSREERQR